MNRDKKLYFEVMRIIACSLVIYNHIEGYRLYMISNGIKQFFYMCLTMLTRINVPIFFMISGALLLKKEENMTFVLRKRVFRIAGTLFLFDGVYIVVCKLVSIKQGWNMDISMGEYLYDFLTNQFNGTVAYWYMYAYMGFLLCLPFMQRMVKKFSKDEFFTLLGLHFITSSFIPMINIGLSKLGFETIYLCGDFQVPLAFAKAFFYPLIGYYLEYNIDIFKLKRCHIIGMSIIGCLGILLSNLCTYYEGITTGTYTQNYVQLFDYLTAIVVFLIIKYIFNLKWSIKNDIGKLIGFLGSLTFGIYLMDPILKIVWYEEFNIWAESKFPTLIVSIGWIIISMLGGGCVTYVMKKIPGVKSLI